jgi:hypothetical protein
MKNKSEKQHLKEESGREIQENKRCKILIRKDKQNNKKCKQNMMLNALKQIKNSIKNVRPNFLKSGKKLMIARNRSMKH